VSLELGKILVEMRPGGRGEQSAQAHRQERLVRVPGEPAYGLVDREQLPFQVVRADEVEAVLDQVAVARVALAQGGLLARDLGSVADTLEHGGQRLEVVGMRDQVVRRPKAEGLSRDLAVLESACDQHHRQVEPAVASQRLQSVQRLQRAGAMLQHDRVVRARLRRGAGKTLQSSRNAVHEGQSDVRGADGEVRLHDVGIGDAVVGVEHPQGARPARPLGAEPLQRALERGRQAGQIVLPLDQVVVGAGLQGRDRGLSRLHTGQHDHGHRQRQLADLHDELQPAAVGEAQIDQHEVVDELPGEPGTGVAQRGHGVELDLGCATGELAPGQLGVASVIFDVENAHRL